MKSVEGNCYKGRMQRTEREVGKTRKRWMCARGVAGSRAERLVHRDKVKEAEKGAAVTNKTSSRGAGWAREGSSVRRVERKKEQVQDPSRTSRKGAHRTIRPAETGPDRPRRSFGWGAASAEKPSIVSRAADGLREEVRAAES